jgi:sulfate permease, SulP family
MAAGLTLVAIAVPEQIATAKLVYMPAAAGLYAFIAGSLLFALLGSSGQMSVGADSTIAPILAAGAAGLAAAGTPRYMHLVSFLAVMVGGVVIASGLLRLGWLCEFLSTPRDHRSPGRDRRRDSGPPDSCHPWIAWRRRDPAEPGAEDH